MILKILINVRINCLIRHSRLLYRNGVNLNDNLLSTISAEFESIEVWLHEIPNNPKKPFLPSPSSLESTLFICSIFNISVILKNIGLLKLRGIKTIDTVSCCFSYWNAIWIKLFHCGFHIDSIYFPIFKTGSKNKVVFIYFIWSLKIPFYI